MTGIWLALGEAYVEPNHPQDLDTQQPEVAGTFPVSPKPLFFRPAPSYHDNSIADIY